HEDVTNIVLNDLVEALQPVRVSITGEFNVRGGITTVVRAGYTRPSQPSDR
ncbi:MAG: NADPH-dependent 7-cyano-7-deazaguanine reductase QueF, partial [Chloroflexi bacterium]|nr:NADPH-dependent 7-cyano-7-deazaguanine reductase QueF [Chloroflexota bacterium]